MSNRKNDGEVLIGRISKEAAALGLNIVNGTRTKTQTDHGNVVRTDEPLFDSVVGRGPGDDPNDLNPWDIGGMRGKRTLDKVSQEVHYKPQGGSGAPVAQHTSKELADAAEHDAQKGQKKRKIRELEKQAEEQRGKIEHLHSRIGEMASDFSTKEGKMKAQLEKVNAEKDLAQATATQLATQQAGIIKALQDRNKHLEFLRAQAPLPDVPKVDTFAREQMDAVIKRNAELEESIKEFQAYNAMLKETNAANDLRKGNYIQCMNELAQTQQELAQTQEQLKQAYTLIRDLQPMAAEGQYVHVLSEEDLQRKEEDNRSKGKALGWGLLN